MGCKGLGVNKGSSRLPIKCGMAMYGQHTACQAYTEGQMVAHQVGQAPFFCPAVYKLLLRLGV